MKYSLINYNNELNHWGAEALWEATFSRLLSNKQTNLSWFCQMDLQQVRGSRMEITMCYEVKEVSRECGRRTEKLMNQDCWWTRGTAHSWWCSSERRITGRRDVSIAAGYFLTVSCWDKRFQTCRAEQGCAQTTFTEKTLVSVGCYRFNFY